MTRTQTHQHHDYYTARATIATYKCCGRIIITSLGWTPVVKLEFWEQIGSQDYI